MAKCEHCEKEVLFPFVCPYCGKTFCAEHRLAENHQCPNLPEEPPHHACWFRRKKQNARVGIGVCPRCGSNLNKELGFDEKRDAEFFRCKECGNTYIQQKKFPHDYIETKAAEPRIGVCPICSSSSSEMIGYDAKKMIFECNVCGHKYIQRKRFPYEYIES